jgi:hypothetical protein
MNDKKMRDRFRDEIRKHDNDLFLVSDENDLIKLKNEKNIYRISDPYIAQGLINLCENNPDDKLPEVIEKLRKLAYYHDKPFHFIDTIVSYGVWRKEDGGIQPDHFYVNVKYDSDFVGKPILLVNKYDVSKELILKGRIGITHPKASKTHFHLNQDQANYLFGQYFSVKTGDAIATIVDFNEKVKDWNPTKNDYDYIDFKKLP